ncbi:hypothetical protein IFR04_007869 [Cadophora malorum]|uniref:Uncharacterized protein n=1 Tax=Cadophora malorum TaxID=108018 RepID=A0A8H7WA92_9HELO|nr:hypothetical protein IFR04_007869 [Cadophora malorum]
MSEKVHPPLGHNSIWRQFRHPSGRRIHIAATPEEHERLKQELTKSEPDLEFDLCIRGSPEHVQMIRELKAHHENRRESIRENHSDIYNDFEHIQSELTAIAAELDMLTDHHVTLDANFSKFGYSAHLRTLDVEDRAGSSSGASSFSDGSEASNQAGMNMKFWKRPVVRQYFHKGLLWRSKASGEVASFELFIDLLYVGVIEAIGHTASEHATGSALLHYLVTYAMSAKMWVDITNMTNWFETGDIMQRLSILFFLLCLLGFTVNIANAFDTTYTATVAFYLGARLLQGVYFAWVAIWVPTVRGPMTLQSISVFVISAVWIASIHVKYPARLGLMIPAVLCDLFGSMCIALIMRTFQKFNVSESKTRVSLLMTRLSTHFEFFPAFNIEHRVERNNTFIALVFGYSILAILYQNRYSVFASNAIFGKACLSLIQAFCFNWIYFEIDLLNMSVHAIRRHYVSAWVWIFGHLPFIMGYTLSATAMSKIVLAHDVSHSDEGSLEKPYDEESPEYVATGLRWFYCGGLCVALIFSCVISLSHLYHVKEDARLTQSYRLIYRSGAAISILMLPLAPKERLESLALVGITCSIVISCLIVDIYGLSSKDKEYVPLYLERSLWSSLRKLFNGYMLIGALFSFWVGGFSQKEKQKIKYKAHCKLDEERKTQITENLEKGHKTTIEDILKKTSKSKPESETPHWTDHHNANTHLAA